MVINIELLNSFLFVTVEVQEAGVQNAQVRRKGDKVSPHTGEPATVYGVG